MWSFSGGTQKRKITTKIHIVHTHENTQNEMKRIFFFDWSNEKTDWKKVKCWTKQKKTVKFFSALFEFLLTNLFWSKINIYLHLERREPPRLSLTSHILCDCMHLNFRISQFLFCSLATCVCVYTAWLFHSLSRSFYFYLSFCFFFSLSLPLSTLVCFNRRNDEDDCFYYYCSV